MAIKEFSIRRIVSGILMTVLAFYTFYRGILFREYASKFSVFLGKAIKINFMDNGTALIIYSLFVLLIGIAFIISYKKIPEKKNEYGIVILYFIGGVIAGFCTSGVFEPITRILVFLSFLFTLTGIAWTKAEYKSDLTKTNATPGVKINATKNSYSDLRDLKKLLDDGIITDEEFDAKKKQILNL